MPRWEYCDECKRAYDPNKYTAEERLLQAIFGKHVCSECKEKIDTIICTRCKKRTSDPVYFGDDPYHPVCLAVKLARR